MGLFWSTVMSIGYLESQTYFIFLGPIAVYYVEATCLEKNLTSLTHVYDFITISISFQSGGKGGFPTTLVITS